MLVHRERQLHPQHFLRQGHGGREGIQHLHPLVHELAFVLGVLEQHGRAVVMDLPVQHRAQVVVEFLAGSWVSTAMPV